MHFVAPSPAYKRKRSLYAPSTGVLHVLSLCVYACVQIAVYLHVSMRAASAEIVLSAHSSSMKHKRQSMRVTVDDVSRNLTASYSSPFFSRPFRGFLFVQGGQPTRSRDTARSRCSPRTSFPI